MGILSVTARRLRTASLVVGLAALVAACSGPGFVDEPSGYTDDSNLVKSLMNGLGAVDANQESIEYRQRAPLVMPSEGSVAALPQPVQDGRTAEERVQNWPVDPETPITTVELTDTDTRNGRLLPGNELSRSLPIANQSSDRDNLRTIRNDAAAPVLTPDEIRAARQQIDDIRQATIDLQTSGPATRQYLTDPPTRFTTPATTAEFALPEEGRKARKVDECAQGNLDARTYTRCRYKQNQ